MSALDHYFLPVRCLVCGLTGTSWWTEKERPSQYTGTGRTLDHVSEGFKIVPAQDRKSDPQNGLEKKLEMTMTFRDVRELVPSELLANFQTSFYSEQVEVVFEFIGI